MNSIRKLAPLIANSSRQAVPSINGYDYQIWRTVQAWLQLQHGEELYVECAEDYDIIGPDFATVVQVKSSRSNITLGSKGALDAIASFWDLSQRNEHHPPIKMVFLSRGNIGRERDAAFGQEKGLEVWRAAAGGNPAAIEKLRTYLLGRDEVPSGLKELLRTQNDTVLKQALFSRIDWCLGQPSTESIAKSVHEIVLRIISGKGLSPLVVDRAVNAFLVHCYSAATKTEVELRRLTVETREYVLANAGCINVPLTIEFLSSIQLAPRNHSVDDALRRFRETLSGGIAQMPSFPYGVAHKPRSTAVAQAVESLIDALHEEVSSAAAEQLAYDRFHAFWRRMVVEVVQRWRKYYGIEMTDPRGCIYNGHLLLAARDPNSSALSDRAIEVRARVQERMTYTPIDGERIMLNATSEPDRVNSLRWNLDVRIDGGSYTTTSTLHNRFFWYPSHTDEWYEHEQFLSYAHVVEKLLLGWEPVGFVSFNVGEGAPANPVHPELIPIVSHTTTEELSSIRSRVARIQTAYRVSEEVTFPLRFSDEYFHPALSEDAIERAVRSLTAKLRAGPGPEFTTHIPVVSLDHGRGIWLTYRGWYLQFENGPQIWPRIAPAELICFPGSRT
ncbi:hypothetical protein LGM58_42595 [Burkholderia contaminans]|uniref:hypothetical protein n=1 Tax=Burkholderia contaminans TaxID=488447 RepID=UPI001CF47776|nr:hypothetical protein [Burkholderia contaminans]MCA7889871.1 hypothetical protein [Burkholderia contaminans]